MKQFKKFFFALTLISAVLFSACNDISMDESQSDSDGRAFISVSVKDFARLISPTNTEEKDIVLVNLYSKESGATGEAELVKEWEATESKNALEVMNSDDPILFETGTYDFTLKLYVKNKYASGSIVSQEATITKEIKAGQNELVFNTKYAGETGFVNIMLYWHELDNVGIKITSASAGLYSVKNDFSIGELVEGTETALDVTDNPDYGVAYGETTYQQQVAAGKYYLVIKLEREGVETPDVWFELIEVVGGAYTETEVEFENPNDYYTIEYKTPGQDGDWVNVAAATSEDESATRWLSDASPVYSRNGNTSVVPPSKITRPNEIKGDDNVVSKFEFVGWYRDADCSGDKVEIINAGDANNSTNIVLYAKWKEIVGMSIDVTINDGDDSDIVVTNNAENLTGTTLIFTADEGYDSYTWKVDGEIQDESGNELSYDMTDKATGVYDVVLLAKKGEEYYSYLAQIEWTRKYQVTFQLVGAPDEITGEGVEPVYVAENAENKTITAPEVTPPYGWYLDEVFNLPFDFEENEITESITIYGCWQLGTTFYVAEDGVDEEGRGTYGRPLASIEGAVKLMTNDELEYTISVVGDVKGEQKIRSSSELGTGGLAKSITLEGGGELDGEQKTRVLSVRTNVPVIIQNLIITNGNAGDESGGGLYVASGASVTLGEGALITENTAKRGGGVDVDGTLIIEDAESINITSNTSSGYGAGLYVSGLLDMRGGDIDTNGFTDGTSDEAQGRGIYVCAPSGSVKINGSAIIEDEVYLSSGTGLIVAGELTNSSSDTVATITPASYNSETQWVSVAEDSGVNLSDAVARIAVTDEVITDSGNITGYNKYRLTEEGKLQAFANIDDIVSQITSMTKSDTIYVSGYMVQDDLVTIVNAMKELCPEYSSVAPDIMIKLDLSNTTGLTKLSGEFCEVWNLGELILPEGITTISAVGERTDNLKTMNIPASVTEIDDGAFYRSCASLTIAEGNTSYKIVNKALYTADLTKLVAYANKDDEDGSCEVLASATEIAPWAFSFAKKLKTLTFATPSSLYKIGQEAFDYCDALEDIVLPESVTELGTGVFQYAYVTSMVLPSGLTEIPASAFSNNKFTRIVIPDGVTTIAGSAFWACRNLEAIVIPNSVKTIGSSAFGSCEKLTLVCYKGTETEKENISIGSGNDALTNATWDYNSDGTIPVMPITLNTGTEISAAIASLFTDITTDDTFAFAKSTSKPSEASVYLDSGNKIPVWLDTGTASVYYYAGSDYTLVLNADSSEMFKGCSKLSSIDVSAFDTSNVTDMRGMFAECSNLTSVNLSGFDTSSVTDMSGMFNNCSALTSLDLSTFNTSSVETMANMFYGCTYLETLTLGENFTTGNVTDMSSMFYNCSALTSLDLSTFNTSSVTSMASMFKACKKLGTLTLGDNFTTAKVTNMASMFSSCKLLRPLDVSKFDTSNVTDMSYMFNHCEWLETLDVSNFNTSKVTNMAYMFNECSVLTSLDVSNFDFSALEEPASGNAGHSNFMFYGCTALSSVVLPSTGLTKLGYYEFGSDIKLTSITIPATVTEIGERAFYGCTGLTSIVIPASVTTIGDYAFDGCENLTAINCRGAEGSITLGSAWKPSSATVNYNYGN